MNIFDKNTPLDFPGNEKVLIIGGPGTGKSTRIVESCNTLFENKKPFFCILGEPSLYFGREFLKFGSNYFYTNTPNLLSDFLNPSFNDYGNLDKMIERVIKEEITILVDECQIFPYVLQGLLRNKAKSFLAATQNLNGFYLFFENCYDYFDTIYIGQTSIDNQFVGEDKLFKTSSDFMEAMWAIKQFGFLKITKNKGIEQMQKNTKNEISDVFVDLMNNELDRNSEKGNWADWKPSPAELISIIMHETALLNKAVALNDVKEIAVRTAAIANYSEKMFMIHYDDVVKPEPVSQVSADEMLNKINSIPEEEIFKIADEIPSADSDNASNTSSQEDSQNKTSSNNQQEQVFQMFEKALGNVPPEVANFVDALSMLITSKPVKTVLKDDISPFVADVKTVIDDIYQEAKEMAQKQGFDKAGQTVKKEQEEQKSPVDTYIEELVGFSRTLKNDGYDLKNFSGLLSPLVARLVDFSNSNFSFDSMENGGFHKEQIERALEFSKYCVFAKMREKIAGHAMMSDYVGYFAKDEIDLIEALIDGTDNGFKILGVFSK